MTIRSIGEMPAYPATAQMNSILDESGGRPESGMTYRQWLVGQIAQGLAANPHVGAPRVMDLAMQLADEIIERLNTRESE